MAKVHFAAFEESKFAQSEFCGGVLWAAYAQSGQSFTEVEADLIIMENIFLQISERVDEFGREQKQIIGQMSQNFDSVQNTAACGMEQWRIFSCNNLTVRQLESCGTKDIEITFAGLFGGLSGGVAAGSDNGAVKFGDIKVIHKQFDAVGNAAGL